MPSFTVRVEMRGASQEMYDKLHEAMEADGFSRTIRDTADAVWELPAGEYRLEGSALDVDEACTKAKRVAEGVMLGSWVFVTQGEFCSWNYDPQP